MKIDSISDAIQRSQVRISDHADEEAEADELTFDEIYFSVLHGEIIEDDPDEKPYPSCLVYGMTFGGDPAHPVWTYNEENQWAVLVTVYRPDPDLWIVWREMKRS